MRKNSARAVAVLCATSIFLCRIPNISAFANIKGNNETKDKKNISWELEKLPGSRTTSSITMEDENEHSKTTINTINKSGSVSNVNGVYNYNGEHVETIKEYAPVQLTDKKEEKIEVGEDGKKYLVTYIPTEQKINVKYEENISYEYPLITTPGETKTGTFDAGTLKEVEEFLKAEKCTDIKRDKKGFPTYAKSEKIIPVEKVAGDIENSDGTVTRIIEQKGSENDSEKTWEVIYPKKIVKEIYFTQETINEDKRPSIAINGNNSLVKEGAVYDSAFKLMDELTTKRTLNTENGPQFTYSLAGFDLFANRLHGAMHVDGNIAINNIDNNYGLFVKGGYGYPYSNEFSYIGGTTIEGSLCFDSSTKNVVVNSNNIKVNNYGRDTVYSLTTPKGVVTLDNTYPRDTNIYGTRQDIGIIDNLNYFAYLSSELRNNAVASSSIVDLDSAINSIEASINNCLSKGNTLPKMYVYNISASSISSRRNGDQTFFNFGTFLNKPQIVNAGRPTIIFNVVDINSNDFDINRELNTYHGDKEPLAGNIIWNFADYSGSISTSTDVVGFILAPKAYVKTTSNGHNEGCIMADRVCIHKEIHFTPLNYTTEKFEPIIKFAMTSSVTEYTKSQKFKEVHKCDEDNSIIPGQEKYSEPYEEPKTEEPKTEEPKTEEPKTEEPKTEEPKTEEPKTEEIKTEEPKTEEPKTEEPKTEEPKTEEPKTEVPSTEEPKTEEPSTEEPKTEVPKTEVPSTEEPKTEEPKTEEPKTEEPKTEEPKTEEPKTEEPKTEVPKTEEPKTEVPKTEEPKTEEPKTEEPKTEVPSTEEPKTEVPSTEEPKTEVPSTEEPSTEEPSTEVPSTEEPSTEEPSTEEPKTEEPSTEEPSTEEPSTEEPSTEEPKTEVPSTEEPKTEVPSTEEPSTEEPRDDVPGSETFIEDPDVPLVDVFDEPVPLLDSVPKTGDERPRTQILLIMSLGCWFAAIVMGKRYKKQK